MDPLSRCRVRLWFGDALIATHAAARPLATRYAAAMAKRFPGLTVTVEDLPEPNAGERELPAELLWPLTAM